METILTTTLSLTLISAAIALLLTLADRTIGNYGEVKLIINEEKEYIVEGGNSLLSTLIDQKYLYPLPAEVREHVVTVRLQSMKVEDQSLQQNYPSYQKKN